MAREAGYVGAMYPWQSGSDGREESQRVHLNPLSGRWLPDTSHLQRHVGLTVAYSIWQYYQATGDLAFLAEHGAEVLLEITRFWASLACYDPARDRYHIRGVMGPDEYSTRYPGATEPGIDDNAYTNVMAVWALLRAQDVLAVLPSTRRTELVESLGLGPAELLHWREVSQRMYVPIGADGVINQFEGYRDLPELDWDSYRRRYGDIQRLDRILEAEGRSVDDYQASKQADVLMLFYLLSADELRELLGRLGYALPPEAIPRTIEYYLARTAHGSTLSVLVHGWVLARANREQALEHFERALRSDIADIQRHHHRGRAPGGDGRVRGPAAALFRGAGNPAGRAVVQPALAATVRPAHVRRAVPGSAVDRPGRWSRGAGIRRARTRRRGPGRLRGRGP